MPNYFVIVKFSPGNTTIARGATEPMTVYTDWTSAEGAAILAQQGNTDGSQFAVCEAVAITGFVTPQVSVTLLGATVPTTV